MTIRRVKPGKPIRSQDVNALREAITATLTGGRGIQVSRMGTKTCISARLPFVRRRSGLNFFGYIPFYVEPTKVWCLHPDGNMVGVRSLDGTVEAVFAVDPDYTYFADTSSPMYEEIDNRNAGYKNKMQKTSAYGDKLWMRKKTDNRIVRVYDTAGNVLSNFTTPSNYTVPWMVAGTTWAQRFVFGSSGSTFTTTYTYDGTATSSTIAGGGTQELTIIGATHAVASESTTGGRYLLSASGVSTSLGFGVFGWYPIHWDNAAVWFRQTVSTPNFQVISSTGVVLGTFSHPASINPVEARSGRLWYLGSVGTTSYCYSQAGLTLGSWTQPAGYNTIAGTTGDYAWFHDSSVPLNFKVYDETGTLTATYTDPALRYPPMPADANYMAWRGGYHWMYDNAMSRIRVYDHTGTKISDFAV